MKVPTVRCILVCCPLVLIVGARSLAVASLGGASLGETRQIGETGVVTTVDYRLTTNNTGGDGQWAIVKLQGTYTNPIVILGVPSSYGGQEVVPRVRGLQYGGKSPSGAFCDGHCFEVRLQEPDCADDRHLAERIPWLVMESGVFYADDGKMVQAGRLLAAGMDSDPNIGTRQTLGGGWHDVSSPSRCSPLSRLPS